MRICDDFKTDVERQLGYSVEMTDEELAVLYQSAVLQVALLYRMIAMRRAW